MYFAKICEGWPADRRIHIDFHPTSNKFNPHIRPLTETGENSHEKENKSLSKAETTDINGQQALS
jgi:hypothetical protein